MRNCFEYFYNNGYDLHVNLEDDSILGKDGLLWYEWANATFGSDDQCFAYCPFMPQNTKVNDRLLLEDITMSVKRLWFEAQGGFGNNRQQYEYILSLGGLFGASFHNTPQSYGMPPEEWKRNVMMIHDQGAFDGPLSFYFLRDKHTISPFISRAQNIGALEGTFNPSAEWHTREVLNKLWIDSDEYKDLDLTKIDYKIFSDPNHNMVKIRL